MIIPAKSQFNWFGGFWQDFQGFNQSEHIIGPGSHVEFPIYTKNTNLVEDHPMNIYGKFGWNLFQRRRVKCEKLTDGRMTDAYPWQKLTWPMARWAKKNFRSNTDTSNSRTQ
jgi:hypothetical protein